ncbi:MAG: hypothetical protein HY813_01730 [Candidatus Portnoybacteria bacterium]|nr:hypothetical protein [Candidatus Portnoybacteria bacterium]
MLLRTKQIIIILAYVLFSFAIAFGVYLLFIKPAPTCFDGKFNQGEEQIDCGGPCPSCEIRTLKGIKILWVKALPTSNANYDLAARIENPNQNYGLRDFSYKFSLYDLNNQLLAERTGISFILPRGERYLLEFKLPVTGTVAKVVLNLDKNIQWERIKDYLPPEANALDKKYEVLKDGTVFSRASATIKNSSRFDYKNVDVLVVAFSGDGEPVAINSTSLSLLAAGQEKYISVPWFFEVFGNVTNIDIEPEVDLYEQAIN